ncbi:MAG: sigma-70 family RNA polymerase sigma factor [bacterium]
MSCRGAVEARVIDMGRSDAELLEASRRGEREAFGALIERYQGVVSAVSYSRTGDRALSEDVAQDTFIAAWRQLDRLREPGRLRAWLCGIARNLARKARHRSRREAPLEDAIAFEGANPFDQAAEAESERVVRDALGRVPETYRDVLVLYYREQRSVREVAAALGLSEAAALQRLARGRQYLADGVTDLVERSLRASGGARNLAAIVLAALPAVAASRAEAATQSHGGTMLKLTLAVVAITGAATTAYIVRTPAAPAPGASIASSTTTAEPAATAGKPTTSSSRAYVSAPALPATPRTGGNAAPRPDDDPGVDRATIERLALYKGPARGPADAPVTIVVFTDLRCTHCGNARGTIDQLWDDYPGKLRLVVKQLPVHESAILPAEAALAAEAQGKFWELHDLMIAHQDDLSRERLNALAERAGLDVAAFKAALDKHSFATALEADKAAAKALDIQGVPAFVINGHRVGGNRAPEMFKDVIDQALAER